jgi:hypothetical protein
MGEKEEEEAEEETKTRGDRLDGWILFCLGEVSKRTVMRMLPVHIQLESRYSMPFPFGLYSSRVFRWTTVAATAAAKNMECSAACQQCVAHARRQFGPEAFLGLSRGGNCSQARMELLISKAGWLAGTGEWEEISSGEPGLRVDRGGEGW